MPRPPRQPSAWETVDWRGSELAGAWAGTFLSELGSECGCAGVGCIPLRTLSDSSIHGRCRERVTFQVSWFFWWNLCILITHRVLRIMFILLTYQIWPDMSRKQDKISCRCIQLTFFSKASLTTSRCAFEIISLISARDFKLRVVNVRSFNHRERSLFLALLF